MVVRIVALLVLLLRHLDAPVPSTRSNSHARRNQASATRGGDDASPASTHGLTSATVSALAPRASSPACGATMNRPCTLVSKSKAYPAHASVSKRQLPKMACRWSLTGVCAAPHRLRRRKSLPQYAFAEEPPLLFHRLKWQGERGRMRCKSARANRDSRAGRARFVFPLPDALRRRALSAFFRELCSLMASAS